MFVLRDARIVRYEVEECTNLAGHEGNHDCKKKNHTCVDICFLFGNHPIATNLVV